MEKKGRQTKATGNGLQFTTTARAVSPSQPHLRYVRTFVLLIGFFFFPFFVFAHKILWQLPSLFPISLCVVFTGSIFTVVQRQNVK